MRHCRTPASKIPSVHIEPETTSPGEFREPAAFSQLGEGPPDGLHGRFSAQCSQVAAAVALCSLDQADLIARAHAGRLILQGAAQHSLPPPCIWHRYVDPLHQPPPVMRCTTCRSACLGLQRISCDLSSPASVVKAMSQERHHLIDRLFKKSLTASLSPCGRPLLPAYLTASSSSWGLFVAPTTTTLLLA